MPIKAMMLLPIPEVDDTWVADMLASHRTHCEMTRCALAATQVYFYPPVAAFLCKLHFDFAQDQPLIAVSRLTTSLNEGLRLHSFIKHNQEAGGALMDSILERDKEVERQAELAKSREREEQRELRQLIKESGIKVGAPDDELLVARQRQDLRARMGEPLMGRPRKPIEPVGPAAHPRHQPDGLFPIRPIM